MPLPFVLQDASVVTPTKAFGSIERMPCGAYRRFEGYGVLRPRDGFALRSGPFAQDDKVRLLCLLLIICYAAVFFAIRSMH